LTVGDVEVVAVFELAAGPLIQWLLP